MQIDPVYPRLFISNIYSGGDQNFKTLVLNPRLISTGLFVFNSTHKDASLIASSASIFVFFTMLITQPATLRLLITV